MSSKFLNNIELTAGLVDGSNSTGTSGYLLSSTGTATSWVAPTTVAVGESEQVHIACKNTSGVAISKGDPVYITGTVGTSFRIEIAKADAGDPAKMPAVGLVETDLAINAEGFVIVSGVLKNVTTDPLSTGDGTPSSNDTIYVKVGGGLTRTKPTTAANLIQNVGKVGRVQGTSAGSIAVSTIMRTNDVPNLNTGKIWVGSSTYTTESGVVYLDEINGRMLINTTTATSLSPDLEIGGSDSPVIVLNAATTAPFNYSSNYIWATRNNSTSPPLGYLGWDNNSTYDGVRLSALNTSTYARTALELSTRTSGTSKIQILNSDVITILNSTLNVGINTTIPTQKLHVTGNVYITGAYYDSNNSPGTSGQILSSTATGTDWVSLSEISGVDGTGTANYVAKWSDTDTITDSVIYDNGTNVGIGTTSPTSLLTLESSGTSPYPGIDIKSTSFYPGGEIRFLNSAGTEVSSIESFNNPGVSYLKLNYGSGSLSSSIALDDGQLIFYTAGGERMRVDSSGRVGIGTTSPNQKLTIKGTDQYVATEQTNYVWGGTTTIGLRMGTDATAGVLDFRRWTGTATNHGSVLITQYNSDGGYGLDFRVDALSTNSEATSSRMFLSTSGEVGIGTRSPGTKLDVIGEGRFSGRLYTNSSSTSSVGILGKAIANGWAARYDSNNNNFSGFFFDINNQAVIIGRNASGTITNWIHASGVSYFNGGNIGIGTTNPGKLLELSGGANVAVIRLRDTTSNVWDIQNSTFGKLDFIRGGTNTYMRIDQGGNVGINTTTPQAKLDVNGGVRIANDASTAQASNVGTLRYRTSGNNSYVDMVMQTGASTYAWVNIVTNTW